MKKLMLCLLVLSIILSLAFPVVYADDDSSNLFSGWTDDQLVFMLGQMEAEINKRGLSIPKDSLPTITNNNYEDYDFSEWTNDQLLITFDQVKDEITRRELSLPSIGMGEDVHDARINLIMEELPNIIGLLGTDQSCTYYEELNRFSYSYTLKVQSRILCKHSKVL